MIFALIGISGVGKSYLANYVLSKCNGVKKLTAVTTRKKRENERDGIDKYFLSYEQFEAEKERLILIRKMYGEYYGFWKKDITVEENLVVELFYKDYLSIKECYPVKGIYIWTLENEHRKNLLKNRYANKTDFLTREIIDIYNNYYHKKMLKSGAFDFDICNYYTEESKNNLVRIIESKGK